MLDAAACYEAVRTRDRRFDGQFFTGVTSTGIFCRPSCPARTPKAANTTFFAHAAAAMEAGFRACKRCRPELSPGNDEWNRSATLAAGALRLIDDGVVDTVGVSGLAARLGVSDRHLRRELQAALGAGPLALARARRVRVARMLLDSTAMSATDVAHASGFGSVRQFNEDMAAAFGVPPTELRRRPGGPKAGAFTVRLASRTPIVADSILGFLRPRAIRGVETVTEDTYQRRIVGGEVTVRFEHDAAIVTFDVSDVGVVADVVGRVRRMADLDADLDLIGAALDADPLLAERRAAVGLPRLIGGWDPFEIGVRAVVGQQVSVAGAATVLSRIADRAGAGQGFPTADAVADADLDGVGMPQARIDTVQRLARAMADGSVVIDRASHPDEVVASLVGLRGIGPWTAGYISMRALPDPNGWPPGDLGLRRSTGLSAKELDRERCEQWRPWRAYAALLLWASDPHSSGRAAATPTPSN